MIPYGKHYIDDDDIAAVVDVLKHGALTQGPKIDEFENVIADYTGAKHAVAVSSGTAALHLACMVMDLTSSDEVITTPNTFIATPNSILYAGAKPRFADIDDNSLNICPDDLSVRCKKIRNLRAIIPVHFAGMPCDMEAIKELADKYGIAIVEDASHAFGGKYLDEPIGSCKYSDICVLSFHPIKSITSGEGGMSLTNNFILAKKISKP